MLKLERDQIAAQLAALNQILHSLPGDDYLGRVGFESQRDELEDRLTHLAGIVHNRARVALYFGGGPVIGSDGIQAEFGTKILGTFQDLVTKVWGSLDGIDIQPMGPIKDKDASQLHITSVVHGSFGFVLEELEGQDEPLFPSSLSQAAEQAAQYISTFTDENEVRFSQLIDTLNPRVFQSIREFFGYLHKDKATFRLVDGEIDRRFDRISIERAWNRAEASNVLEERLYIVGRLLGVIPVKRRFELESSETGIVIEGKVGSQFGQSYLERMNNEQFAGRSWRALLHKRTVAKLGRDPADYYTLLELQEVPQ
jgi:hypothetical protein